MRQQPETVLFVDDEEIVLDWLTDAFSRDFHLRVARSGERAIKILEEQPVSVIVSDQRMPRMSGVELLSIVQKRFPETVRLLMTAYREVDDIIDAVNRGHIYQVLTKPLKDIELRQVLEQAIRYRRLTMENRLLAEELTRINRDLEQTVEERTLQLAEKNEALQTHLDQSESLARFSRRINLLSYERLFEVLSEELPSLLSVDFFSLYLLERGDPENGNGDRLVCRAHNHPQGVGESEIPLDELPPGIMRDVLERKVPIMVGNVSRSTYQPNTPRAKYKGQSCCTLPLMIEKNVIAILNLTGPGDRVFSEKDFSVFNHVCEDLASALSNCALHVKTEQLAITDGLTRLYNLSYFLERLDGEIDRAVRFMSPLSCIMIDLDFFKQVNDRYGHDEGNRVLREVSKVLAASKRKIDMLARFGGEEFILSLPGTDKEGALEVARRILENLREHAIQCRGDRVRVTASIGVATMDGSVADKEDLIRAADTGLLRAKQTGRDQVVYQEFPVEDAS